MHKTCKCDKNYKSPLNCYKSLFNFCVICSKLGTFKNLKYNLDFFCYKALFARLGLIFFFHGQCQRSKNIKSKAIKFFCYISATWNIAVDVNVFLRFVQELNKIKWMGVGVRITSSPLFKNF